jgi:O-antigen/teichoic acid export membrane protein
MLNRAKLAGDTLSSLAIHVAPRLASVLLFWFVGRWTGSSEAGKFALATTFLLITTTVMRGLDDLVVREVARQPDQAAQFLRNFVTLRLVLAAGLYALVFVAVRGVFQYPETTAAPVLIMTLSALPDGVGHVAQSVLMGQRRFAGPAIILMATSVVKVAGGVGVLLSGGGLEAVCLVWLAASALGAVAILVVGLWRAGAFHWAGWLDWALLSTYARPALSFLAITLLLAFESQTDTLVLSKVRSEAEIGWYGAATSVAFGLLTFSQAYRFTVYPLMARYARESPERLGQFYRASLKLIALAILPLSAGLIITAPQIIALLYGAEFQPAVAPLRFLGIALIFMFGNEPNSRMMLVNDRQRQALWFLGAAMGVNIILNLILTPWLGAAGAALARLGSTLCLFGCYSYYVATRLVVVDFWSLSYVAIIGALVMLLLVLPFQTLPLPMVIFGGVIIYVITISLLDRTLPQRLTSALRLAGRHNTPK